MSAGLEALHEADAALARIDSFIATLGTGTVIYAVALWYTGGRQMIGNLPPSFFLVNSGSIFGMPITAFYVLVVALVLWIVTEYLPIGRYLYAIGNPRSDWCFKTESEPGLNGRALNYARGRVLGGCSSINAMIYMRGQRSDYDHWAELGNRGWSWKEVLPYFIRVEDYAHGADELHGAGGELRVEERRVSWKILDAWRDAAEECGIPKIAEFNRGDNFGNAYFQVNQRRGVRVNLVRAFLRPVQHRPNLTVLTDQHIRKAAVPALSRELLPRVQLPTRLAGATGHDHSTDILSLKHPERRFSEIARQLDDLVAEPQVGLVGTKAIHRICVRQALHRSLDLDADQPPDCRDQ